MYQGVLISPGNMTARDSASDYPLGATDAEHERLIRQAQWVNPHTERCFREAGIGPGYRVLDLGSVSEMWLCCWPSLLVQRVRS